MASQTQIDLFESLKPSHVRDEQVAFLDAAILFLGSSVGSGDLFNLAVVHVAAHMTELDTRQNKGMGDGWITSQSEGGSINYAPPIQLGADGMQAYFSTTQHGLAFLAIRTRKKRFGPFLLNGSTRLRMP